MQSEINDKLKCSGCNVCLNECPVYEYYRCEAFSSRGKMEMLNLYQSGKIKIEDMKDIFESCTICKRCENVCTQGIETSVIFRNTRNLIIQNKIINTSIEAIKTQINEIGNPYDECQPIAIPANYRVNNNDTLLWLGCTIRHLGLAEDWLKFFMKINYMPVILDNEKCCGSFLNNCGYKEDYREVMEKNIEILSKFRKIITLCPSCYSIFRNDSRLKNVIFITAILDKFKNKLKISKSLNKPILIFEPCHLRNCFPGESFVDPILKILKKDHCDYEISSDIFGAKCCGSGGGLFVSSPEISIENVKRIMGEAQGRNIVTMCPFCYRSFKKATNEVMQVVDLLST